MAEELTTAMHSEFIGEEIEYTDILIMSAYGAIKRGATKQEALSKYHLTESDYDNNIDRVLTANS